MSFLVFPQVRLHALCPLVCCVLPEMGTVEQVRPGQSSQRPFLHVNIGWWNSDHCEFFVSLDSVDNNKMPFGPVLVNSSRLFSGNNFWRVRPFAYCCVELKMNLPATRSALKFVKPRAMNHGLMREQVLWTNYTPYNAAEVHLSSVFWFWQRISWEGKARFLSHSPRPQFPHSC